MLMKLLDRLRRDKKWEEFTLMGDKGFYLYNNKLVCFVRTTNKEQ